MIIGVIADTHIPDRAKDIPKGILEDFKKADMVIHAGDLVDLSVLETLRNSCTNIKAVYGNMDPYEARKKIPEKEIISIANYKIGVMHGYGSAAQLIDILEQSFKNDFVDLIIFGHSHTSFNEYKDGVLYFNPGSPTDKTFAPYNSYGIIEITDRIKARVVRV